MSAVEKLGDDLGQIAFRIETNLSTLGRYNPPDLIIADCLDALNRDSERLKEIKNRILSLDKTPTP